MRAGKILRPQRTDRYLFDPLAKRMQRPLERRILGLMLGVEHPPGFFSFRPRRRASSVFDTFCSRIETYSAALIDVPSSRQARCASRFLVLGSGMSARQSRHAHRHVYLRSAQCRDRTAAVPGALRMQIRASCSAKLSPVSVDGRLAASVATHGAGQCQWIDQEMSKSSSEVVDGTAASRYSRRYVQRVISIILPSCMGRPTWYPTTAPSRESFRSFFPHAWVWCLYGCVARPDLGALATRPAHAPTRSPCWPAAAGRRKRSGRSCRPHRG